MLSPGDGEPSPKLAVELRKRRWAALTRGRQAEALALRERSPADYLPPEVR